MPQSDATAQLRRGVVVPVVLALLRHAPRYGFEIVQTLRRYEALAISDGTIYPLLSRLESAALVRSEWSLEPGERPRRYYTLTDLGREELAAFRSGWNEIKVSLDGLLSDAAEEPKKETERDE